jgi:hypothetical protein
MTKIIQKSIYITNKLMNAVIVIVIYGASAFIVFQLIRLLLSIISGY